MKKNVLKTVLVLLVVLVGALAWLGINDYIDRSHCVCSKLTAETQTFAMDDSFYRVCEKDTLASGTFMIVRTTCDHGRKIHLTVQPDEGTYSGYLITE